MLDVPSMEGLGRSFSEAANSPPPAAEGAWPNRPSTDLKRGWLSER